MRTVAALYVDPRGPYVSMPGVDPWDESRDAKRYAGDHPVVAHPPCGPWSKLRHMAFKDDPQCAIRAVEQVRKFGGVLEHPAHSLLWRECRLPMPGELPDAFGGRTFEANQLAWGHACNKPTWLYVVGVSAARVAAGVRTGGTPTHIICTGPGLRNNHLPVASKQVKRRTPQPFADWLVSLAREARR